MSTPPSRARSPLKTKDMLIGAMLRVPAQIIQCRIIAELNAAGFDELRVPHMAVLRSTIRCRGEFEQHTTLPLLCAYSCIDMLLSDRLSCLE